MTGRCDSNPAQYERNRRFGHLVHALARAGGGAKLPSVGLCLNASKAVSFLVEGGNDNPRSSAGRKARKNVTLLGGRGPLRPSHEPLVRPGRPTGDGISLATSCQPRAAEHGSLKFRCRNSELSVDDLRTWQGVVSGRAVSTLRSVETRPLAWGFVFVEFRRDPARFDFKLKLSQTSRREKCARCAIEIKCRRKMEKEGRGETSGLLYRRHFFLTSCRRFVSNWYIRHQRSPLVRADVCRFERV